VFHAHNPVIVYLLIIDALVTNRAIVAVIILALTETVEVLVYKYFNVLVLVLEYFR